MLSLHKRVPCDPCITCAGSLQSSAARVSKPDQDSPSMQLEAEHCTSGHPLCTGASTHRRLMRARTESGGWHRRLMAARRQRPWCGCTSSLSSCTRCGHGAPEQPGLHRRSATRYAAFRHMLAYRFHLAGDRQRLFVGSSIDAKHHIKARQSCLRIRCNGHGDRPLASVIVMAASGTIVAAAASLAISSYQRTLEVPA